MGFCAKKKNENGEIVRFKVWLLKDFHKDPILILKRHSPVMDTCSLWHLISMIAHEGLNLHLMDVVITNFYVFMKIDIYMKLLKGLNCQVMQVLEKISQSN